MAIDKYCVKITPNNNVLVLLTDGELRTLQSHVGGHIETLKMTSDITYICNMEGLILRLKRNRLSELITGIRPVYGSVIIAGPVAGDKPTFFDYGRAEAIARNIVERINGEHDE